MRYQECGQGPKNAIAPVQHRSLNPTDHLSSHSAQVLFCQVGKSLIQLWFLGRSKICMVLWVWLLPRRLAWPCNSLSRAAEGRWCSLRIERMASCLSLCDFFFTKKALICWRRLAMCSITTKQHTKTSPDPLRDRAVKQLRSGQRKTNQSCLGFEGKL